MAKDINLKVLNKNVYSVDMLRMKIRVPGQDIQFYFNQFQRDPNVEYWECQKYKEYRYNWTFKENCIDGVNSFWVGYWHNADKDNLSHSLVIEYNPNKCCDMHYLWEILKTFFSYTHSVYVCSVDVACDMPVNIKDVFHYNEGRRRYMKLTTGGDDITHYYGVRGTDGSIKIYNKARELGIQDNCQLTRYEVTRRFDNLTLNSFSVCSRVEFGWDCLVKINIIDSYQYNMDLNGTERALLFAVMNGFPINELPRINKEKVKKILSESAGNTLDSTLFDKCIWDFLKQLDYTICS